MISRKLIIVAVYLVAPLLAPALGTAQTRLLRFPDIHGDKVVFCHAGDLWVASTSGGTAARLTAHPGQELFPKFSPDGAWVAFTGQYDGDEQVYVIPTAGGAPKQLTYYPARGPLPPRWGFDNQVYGWTRDGSAVLFRSMRYGWDLTDTRLYTVKTTGGLPVPLPMPVSGAGDFSPDGNRVVYSPLIRDFRTWKRYEGGWAQDLYVFDLKTYEAAQVTDHPRSDRDPMWIGEKIYFSSDRDGTLNLYSYDPQSGNAEQLTRSATYDVRWPSAGAGGRIVYELNGELRVFDVASGKSLAISIRVPNDGVSMRPAHVSAGGNIEAFALSPKGKRALFAARGDIFTAPIEKGPTRNLTNSSSAHDKWPRWSPDGKKIAFISDRSGEEELYVVNQDGSGEVERLTDNGGEMRYLPVWSPDGKRIAFSDKNGRIFLVEVKNKTRTQVADQKVNAVTDYTWSPNGGHLAFSLTDENYFNSIYIYSVKGGKLRRVTGPYFNEFEPVWDPSGDYLYYLSDRQFAPQIGSLEWNYLVDRESGIFALALRKDVKHPFPPESDEVSTGDDAKGDDKDGKNDKKKDKKKDKGDDKKQEPIKIDFDGLAERVTRVPVTDDNYYNLHAIEGHLLYTRGGPFYYGRRSDVRASLRIFSMKDRKESTVAEDISGYAVSHDGKTVLVRQSGAYNLYDAKPKPGDKKTVSTAGLMVDRVPAEEWETIFDEVWRRFRDFFYVKNMNGYDWKEIGERYRPLLAHVAHRADLNYVLGEMIAELSVSHAYIAGGDYEIPDRPRAALPGARFELDAKAGRYRISKVLRGQNEEARYRAPLTEIGMDVREGDYVMAIDGEELTASKNPYRMLLHKADRPVELTLSAKPSMKGARKITYSPITQERSLVYLGWVEKNREKVDQATRGRVGYLHIPDMGSNGIREFIKWFYGQIRKEGLVIDVRGNGGGNVSQMLIERLRRELLSLDYSRNNEYASPYPATVFNGHLVCILNETSASDGDIFPAMFRQAGLGPLIGKRSWGGVIGISGHGPLLDGGSVYVPEYGFINTEGEWAIENYGVDPDIVVENDPKSVLDGRDPQLERAIEEVMAAIKREPKKVPKRPRDPVRTQSGR
ncbi:MAG: S41 family peptidase [Candidatus Krumholzibacteriia bacterium]